MSDELRTLVRGYFRDKSPESEVRRLMATEAGHDPAVWKQLAQELGLLGLAIPEEYGGQGHGWAELGVVLEEMGRALVCAPFFSTVVLAATTLLESGDEDAKRRYLPRIADGSLIATVALPEHRGRWEVHADGTTLTGVAPFVLDGTTADLIVVPATTATGVSLFAVESGFSATPLKTLDETRKLAAVSLTGAPARSIGAGEAVLDRVYDLAAVALAAEQVGGAQAALDMSVAYLNTRVQFGQLIGAFQALKHMAADVLVEVESARSAAHYALAAAAADTEELPAAASLAQAYCSEAFVHAAHQNIQFHGGMGFTWEAAPHLYYKRARSSEVFLGDPDAHREALARRIGIDRE